MTQEFAQHRMQKLVFQMIGGALVGGVGMALAMSWLGPLLPRDAAIGAICLIGVGLVYAIMGLFVGVGALFPRLGAATLNVADREDLDDQREVLIGSGASCLVLGIALILLALGGPDAAVSGAVAASAIAFAIVLIAAISIVQWHRYDELMREVSLETSAIMAGISMPVITLWASLDHVGSAVALEPLGLIALLAGSMLLAAFIAAGRRGLLKPA